eukprot:4166906-Prymnesium_polylepis.1
MSDPSRAPTSLPCFPNLLRRPRSVLPRQQTGPNVLFPLPLPLGLLVSSHATFEQGGASRTGQRGVRMLAREPDLTSGSPGWAKSDDFCRFR